ncbi:hypothetical protein FK535_04920 [Mycolicibacterium sp. 018/SC-01/001]|uniref:hypothetical protein n=1 Tax=Mycolicibacterium sp. 018/SC-01/001 TaxID=2592069 RepID=UPI0011805AA4|nr:hypothetical protein [Mycolicibacterium sp. 018/SC-01/001]TRW87788.1 hypothetical protein FK535_04920 [Mycolicibacterium sp. 018/SC-01/001]
MIARRRVARAAVGVALILAATFSASALYAYVLEAYDAYGEVPVPGSGILHLPAGEVAAAFVQNDSGDVSIPELDLRLTGPPAAPEARVVEDRGRLWDDESPAHQRLWMITVAAEGDYAVTVEGDVSGYDTPRVALGHTSSNPWLWILFAVLLGGVLAAISFGGDILTATLRRFRRH